MQIAAHCNAVPCVTASKWPLLHLRHTHLCIGLHVNMGRTRLCFTDIGVSTKVCVLNANVPKIYKMWTLRQNISLIKNMNYTVTDGTVRP